MRVTLKMLEEKFPIGSKVSWKGQYCGKVVAYNLCLDEPEIIVKDDRPHFQHKMSSQFSIKSPSISRVMENENEKRA